MKQIIVTEKNLPEFKPYYKNNISAQLHVGLRLYVVSENVPYVTGKRKNFAIVTDMLPGKNALKMCEKNNTEFTPLDNFANCNRWSIPQTIINQL